MFVYPPTIFLGTITLFSHPRYPLQQHRSQLVATRLGRKAVEVERHDAERSRLFDIFEAIVDKHRLGGREIVAREQRLVYCALRLNRMRLARDNLAIKVGIDLLFAQVFDILNRHIRQHNQQVARRFKVGNQAFGRHDLLLILDGAQHISLGGRHIRATKRSQVLRNTIQRACASVVVVPERRQRLARIDKREVLHQLLRATLHISREHHPRQIKNYGLHLIDSSTNILANTIPRC